MPRPQCVLCSAKHLLKLLLDAELVGVATLLLAAVLGTRWEAGVAPGFEVKRAYATAINSFHLLAADHLVAVVLLGEGGQRWLDHTTTKAEHQVQCGL